MAFLLGNLGMIDIGYVLRFWPVLLIAIGVFKIVECQGNYAHSSGIFWIVVGGVFLLGSLGILRVTLAALWPVVLIGIGALMLWRTTLLKRQPPPSSSTSTSSTASPSSSSSTSTGNANWNWSSGFSDSAVGTPPGTASDTPGDASASGTAGESGSADSTRSSTQTSSNSILTAFAVLGSVEQRNNCQDFRGGTMTAVMGSCEIDLRGASITTPHEAVLEVFAMWGGIEVKVPADWSVVSEVNPILGGYEDGTMPPKDGTKRLVIRGLVIMGGFEVSN
jgi:predicted membrane protein